MGITCLTCVAILAYNGRISILIVVVPNNEGRQRLLQIHIFSTKVDDIFSIINLSISSCFNNRITCFRINACFNSIGIFRNIQIVARERVRRCMSCLRISLRTVIQGVTPFEYRNTGIVSVNSESLTRENSDLSIIKGMSITIILLDNPMGEHLVGRSRSSSTCSGFGSIQIVIRIRRSIATISSIIYYVDTNSTINSGTPLRIQIILALYPRTIDVRVVSVCFINNLTPFVHLIRHILRLIIFRGCRNIGVVQNQSVFVERMLEFRISEPADKFVTGTTASGNGNFTTPCNGEVHGLSFATPIQRIIFFQCSIIVDISVRVQKYTETNLTPFSIKNNIIRRHRGESIRRSALIVGKPSVEHITNWPILLIRNIVGIAFNARTVCNARLCVELIRRQCLFYCTISGCASLIIDSIITGISGTAGKFDVKT